ncbi:MAG TPA: MCE family protein [Marmoricola sp.]|nr:MCE family protein [Marmoricola sp.]
MRFPALRHRPGRLRAHVAGYVALLLTGLVALSGCSTIYDLPLPGGASVSNPMTVHVMFRDVLDLVPQSTVKMDDITVGKVTSVQLRGYHADVTIEVPRNIDLPRNTDAAIRQTSLLGEKFISLSAPSDPQGRLRDGDVIGLDHTGRNPEVEEVLGALALLLNGGGVGQLKTIATELNHAIGGREGDVRSVLDQLHTFMGELDRNKAAVVSAIDNINRLASELRRQDGTIKATLNDVPRALKSLNGQRADLVRTLDALQRLSGVGVRVIRASKASTIDSLRDLAPVLTAFAKAGQDMPKALQVFLTYPFADAAVGQNPRVARNLHMGDYTNLSIRLNLDLTQLNLPQAPLPTVTLPGPVQNVCKQVRKQIVAAVDKAMQSPVVQALPPNTRKQLRKTLIAETVKKVNCRKIDPNQLARLVQAELAALLQKLPAALTKDLCSQFPKNPLCQVLTGQSPLPTPTLSVPSSLPGLGRPAPGAYRVPQPADPFGLARHGIDASLGTLLLQGVAS